jgi:hypothetical protein
MLACNDVIDVKRQGIDRNRQMAILTSVLGALTNLLDNVPVHEL